MKIWCVKLTIREEVLGMVETKGCYWFHQDDVPGKHVIVEICEAIVDEEAYE